jgi:hypothetical protein
MPNADSLKSPKLLLDDLNVLPDVWARTRDRRIPDLCRRGVGGGGIGRDEDAEFGPDMVGGDSSTGEMGVGDVLVRDLELRPRSILELEACIPARPAVCLPFGNGFSACPVSSCAGMSDPNGLS